MRALSGASPLQLKELLGRGSCGSVYKAVWKGVPVAVKVIEHDDEELSSPGLSPLSSCAGLHAFSTDVGLSAGLATNALSTRAIEEELERGAQLNTRNLLAAGRAATEQCGGRTMTSSMATTRGSQALLEAAMSSAICHPNIVQTFDYQILDPSSSAGFFGAQGCRPNLNGLSGALQETRIIMEFCDGGTLEDAMHSGRFHGTDAQGRAVADMERVCLTLLDIVKAMEYLHLMRIFLKDLKPKNVLLASSKVDKRGFIAKVSDFGLSQLQPDKSPCNETTSTGVEAAGTVTHMAPEMIAHGVGSCASDVYSFAILAWELYAGRGAHSSLSKVQIMFGVASQDMRPEFPQPTPAWYRDLVSTCWSRDPRARPTFAEIKAILLREIAGVDKLQRDTCAQAP
ncbi:kinase-like protein [Coccomyxa subellipsoidea C-169]|uniref:Kinase-like protein n=1 Tax=Coccomyxa subellipsoidea (strain C-169) TaxID=574566 RepID=I0Z7L3_COCSC|nr:kinase-like protein [Coccomyxa subellipsoidea C-169]EIE26632.1 kinase-like protein [Coccomyxa subellipsoidea C-169]|eukprot:XP_005651176.1 kinase-like protein [Coccomyxa subellipsoidea C-169]